MCMTLNNLTSRNTCWSNRICASSFRTWCSWWISAVSTTSIHYLRTPSICLTWNRGITCTWCCFYNTCSNIYAWIHIFHACSRTLYRSIRASPFRTFSSAYVSATNSTRIPSKTWTLSSFPSCCWSIISASSSICDTSPTNEGAWTQISQTCTRICLCSSITTRSFSTCSSSYINTSNSRNICGRWALSWSISWYY